MFHRIHVLFLAACAAILVRSAQPTILPPEEPGDERIFLGPKDSDPPAAPPLPPLHPDGPPHGADEFHFDDDHHHHGVAIPGQHVAGDGGPDSPDPVGPVHQDGDHHHHDASIPGQHAADEGHFDGSHHHHDDAIMGPHVDGDGPEGHRVPIDGWHMDGDHHHHDLPIEGIHRAGDEHHHHVDGPSHYDGDAHFDGAHHHHDEAIPGPHVDGDGRDGHRIPMDGWHMDGDHHHHDLPIQGDHIDGDEKHHHRSPDAEDKSLSGGGAFVLFCLFSGAAAGLFYWCCWPTVSLWLAERQRRSRRQFVEGGDGTGTGATAYGKSVEMAYERL
eukprot:Polyplicarium_translucidae@DN2721_c2_g1_i1.p1